MVTEQPRLDPPGPDWIKLLGQQSRGKIAGRSLAHWQVATRSELSLPATGTVLATGHQAEFWHPGILAKYLAVQAMAEAVGASWFHLVIDQDEHVGTGAMDIPTRAADGGLAARTIQFRDASPGVVARFQPASPPRGLPQDLHPALDSVAEGLAAVQTALLRHADAPHAASQVAGAAGDLMARWIRPTPTIFASDLLQTELGRAVLGLMETDPTACATAYNRAVASVPEAGITPLEIAPTRVELPLWLVDAEGSRRPAFETDLAAGRDELILMPRALMTTALVRMALADLFVHGSSGMIYDAVMERWLAEWLNVTVSPSAMATADLLLPFDDAGEAPELSAARRDYRKRLHDPASDGSGAVISQAKRRWLDGINAHPRRSPARRKEFLGYHGWLVQERRNHREGLEDAQRRLAEAVRAVGEVHLRTRRTWAFPLYPGSQIDELAAATQAAVGSAVIKTP